MDYNDVIADLESAENEQIECKSSFDRDEIGQTMAALSTAGGGKIYLGVDNDKNPIGIECSKKLNDKIMEVARVVNPNARINIERCQHNSSKEIVRITVNIGNGLVYTYKKIPYIRKGSINHGLEPEEVIEIHKRRKKIYFDEQLCLSQHRPALITDVDENKIKNYLEFKTGRPAESLNTRQFLINKDLLIDGRQVKNVGILVFGKNPSQFIPQNKISISVFPSDEITDHFHKKEFEGDVIDILDRTFIEVEKNITTLTFVNGVRRIDVPEYPMEALREVIVNAVAHRDYYVDNSEIFIKIFKSRIEITNPGGFPYDNKTFEEIEESGLSIRRNPILSNFLEDYNRMEKHGRGIRRIREITKKHGLSSPTITTTENTFKVVFHGIGEDKEKILESPFRKIIDYSQLNKRQELLINYLRKEQSITKTEYEKFFGVSPITATRDLKLLITLDIIQKIGRTRNTKYVLKHNKHIL